MVSGQGWSLSPIRRYAVVHTYVGPARSGEEGYTTRTNVFPPKGVAPYNGEEVVDLLLAMNSRWMRSGIWPPKELEPWAVEVDPTYREGDPIPDREKGFSLREVLAQVLEDTASSRGSCLNPKETIGTVPLRVPKGRMGELILESLEVLIGDVGEEEREMVILRLWSDI